MKKYSIFALAIAIFLVVTPWACEPVFAAPVYITGVPDWDQPALAAGQNKLGPWGAWCIPTATANIIGYYDDKGVAGIGDDQAFPTTPGWPDPNWQDETADASGGARADLGWYFNTNDQGLGGSTPPGGYRGTKVQHIMDGNSAGGGLIGGIPGPPSGYLPSRGLTNFLVRNFGADTMDPVIYGNFNTSVPPLQIDHTYAAAWSEIILSIGKNEPLLAHFYHFNLSGRSSSWDPNLGAFDYANWASAPSYPTAADENTGEVWNPTQGLGHTATVVGYFNAADPCNPLGVDAIIVHDNSDGHPAADPLPLVLPWTGSPGPPAPPWTPWAGLTLIENGVQQAEVLTPNGGEAWVADSNYTVSWLNPGTVADVSIEYSINNGSTWSNVSPPNIGNTGSYLWHTPVADSNQCLVQVSSAIVPSLYDTSDDVFTIYQCTLSYDLNGDCLGNMFDVALLFSEWLECGNPFDSNCVP